MSWNTAAVVGLVLVLVAAYLAAREHRWLRRAEFGSGEVTGMIRCRGSKGGTTYKPEVHFTAQDKTEHDFVRGYASSPPDFKIGDSVIVAYEPGSYEARILTFGQRFGLATFLAVIGLATLALCAAFKLGREMVPRVYVQPRPSQPSQG